MSISHIIAIENNLANILVKSLQGVLSSYMLRLLSSLKAGNISAAKNIASSLSLDSVLMESSKSISTYAKMAFAQGVQQSGYTDTLMNDRHSQALELFTKSVTQNVVDQIKKESFKVISSFDKIKKSDSGLLNEFKSFATTVRTTAERNLRSATQLHTSRLSAYGACLGMAASNIDSYTVNAQLDTKLCAVCRVLHGRVFKVSDARANLQKILELKNPDDIKNYAPWPKLKDAESIVNLTSSEIVAKGWHHPSRHINCRCQIVKLSDIPELSISNTASFRASGAAKLKYVPNKWDFISLGLPSSPETLDLWGASFKVSPMQLLAQVFGGSAGLMTKELLDSRNIRLDLSPTALRFATGSISNSGARFKGQFPWSIDLEDSSVNLATSNLYDLSNPETVLDFTKTIRGLDSAGLSSVSILVTGGGNSFTLVSLGCYPNTQAEWQSLKDNFILKAWKSVEDTVPDTVRGDVKYILKSTDPKSLMLLTDIPFQVQGKPLGEFLLKDAKWQGVLDLNDPLVRQHYVDQTS